MVDAPSTASIYTATGTGIGPGIGFQTGAAAGYDPGADIKG